jgi:hypothetical protein
MIFTGPASRTIEAVAAGMQRLVDELNRFHPTISRLPTYANDAAAADGNLKVGDGYVDSNGFVRRRLS